MISHEKVSRLRAAKDALATSNKVKTDKTKITENLKLNYCNVPLVPSDDLSVVKFPPGDKTPTMVRILRSHLTDREDGKFAKIKDKERVEIALK